MNINYIKILGKKCKGFKFKDFDYGKLVFHPNMKKYIGLFGVISSYNPDNDSFKIIFDDGEFWHYPAEIVLKHIID